MGKVFGRPGADTGEYVSGNDKSKGLDLYEPGGAQVDRFAAGGNGLF